MTFKGLEGRITFLITSPILDLCNAFMNYIYTLIKIKRISSNIAQKSAPKAGSKVPAKKRRMNVKKEKFIIKGRLYS